jgi:hypothetical protein
MLNSSKMQFFVPELPKIGKEASAVNEPAVFTKEDVRKVLECIVKKGTKYGELRGRLEHKDAGLLEQRVIKSSFIVCFESI